MFASNDQASIGIGSLIIFIAMIISAGVAASVVFQTMNTMQQQALQTSQETIKDISSGLRLTHVSGYVSNSSISQLCFFVKTTAGSSAIDLSEARLQLSDSEQMPILLFDNESFSNTISNGLFQTLNMSNVTNEEFGVLVIRDIDNTCSSDNPVINDNDLVGILVNTTSCFSGIAPRTSVSGKIVPEQGMSAIISFTTPSTYTDTIIDLQ
ncbi:MAG: flagellin [Candidatus Thermoplasmatota archaeon]|nr:flagellin [Candidatus Thermoplasmatota archaeon]